MVTKNKNIPYRNKEKIETPSKAPRIAFLLNCCSS